MSHTFFKSSLFFKTTALLVLGLVFSSPQTWGAGGASPQTTQKPVLTTLHRFASDYMYGANPFSTLTLGPDGNFYGITYQSPVIFKMTPAGQFTTLHRFSYDEGIFPLVGLTRGKDGAFYGTTSGSGGKGSGAAFRITPDGQFRRVHSFIGAGGSTPQGASPLARTEPYTARPIRAAQKATARSTG